MTDKQNEQQPAEAPGVDPATLEHLDDIAAELDKENDELEGAIAASATKDQDAEQARVARENGALMTAAGAVAVAERLLRLKWSYVEIKDKQGMVNALAPVFLKHHAEMPPWLVPYQEEFRAAVAVGGVLFGVWEQVREHEQQEAQEQAQEQHDNDRPAPAATAAPERPKVVPAPRPVSTPAPAAPAAVDNGGVSDLLSLSTAMDYA